MGVQAIGRDADFAALVEQAYAAALDPDLWPEWTWAATQALGASAASLHVLQGDEVAHATLLHEDMAIIQRYLDDNMAALDPQMAYARNLRQGCVYADTDHLDRADPQVREYCGWHAANSGLKHYLTALARPGGGYAGAISLHWNHAHGLPSGTARAMLEQLRPAMGQAMALGFAHAAKLQADYWDGLLAARAEPCALLAADGRVLRISPALEALMGQGDGLALREGRLASPDPAADNALAALVGRAVAEGPGTLPTAGARQLPRRSGRTAYVVAIYPLARPRRFLVPDEAAALAVVVDPAAHVPPPTHLWREAFGLTGREAELAAHLMGGHSLESAAETLSMARETARVHLRHLFAKTGVSRQTELLRLLGRLAP